MTWTQDGLGELDDDALLPCDIRAGFHKPFAESVVDHGFGEPVSYRFNSKGYRGEDLDPDAAFRICVVGESHATGHGVAIEQSFGHRLKLHIAHALDLEAARVNCLNFAASGTSADYCTRTIYRQLTRFPADLVVCNMPVPDRVEYFHGSEPKTLNLRLLDPARLEDAPEPLLAFADFYTPQMGDIGLLKNLLLIQEFCRQRGIGHVQALQHRLRAGPRAKHVFPFRAALDDAGFLDNQLFSIRPDKAADGKHAGPRTHAGYAIAVLDKYAQALSGQGDPERARRLVQYVEKTKQTDPDWAFCQDAVMDVRGPVRRRAPAPGAMGQGLAGVQKSDVRPDLHVPSTETCSYAADTSGDVTYRFNSKGYRGEEPDPQAKFRICVIGDDDAFGTGMTLEQTFGHVLKAEIAVALGLPRDQVNVVNLSATGQSADYCVRTIFRQLTGFPVDLVICKLPPPQRVEYCSGESGFQSMDAASVTAQNIDEVPIPLAAYADFYTEDMGQVAQIKNMLMLQQFCTRQGYGLVLANENLPLATRRSAFLTGFDAALDPAHILDDQVFRIRPDKAADRIHAGPRTHRAFAIAVLQQYANGLPDTGEHSLAARLRKHVTHLIESDPDWSFCQQQVARTKADATDTAEHA